jgi:hypothetical protein
MNEKRHNVLQVLTEDLSREMDENGYYVESRKIEEFLQTKEKLETSNILETENEYFGKNSLFLFGDHNPFRKFIQNLVSRNSFVIALNIIIVLNCIFLVFETIDRLKWISEYSSTVFTMLFLIEMCLKIIAYGFVLDDFTYLRDPWNWLDFIIVVAGLISLLPDSSSHLLVLRTFRLIRPLKTISRMPNMRIFISTLINSLVDLSTVFLLLLFFFFIFSILGLSIWTERFEYFCRTSLQPINGSFPPDPQFKNSLCGGVNTCNNNTQLCLSAFNAFSKGNYFFDPELDLMEEANIPSLNYGITNFSNILNSFWIVFQTTTGEGWSDIMYIMMNGHNYYVSLFYFLLCIIINYYFLLNLVVAVLLYNFEKNRSWDDPRRNMLSSSSSSKSKKTDQSNSAQESKYGNYNNLINEESSRKKYRRKYLPIKDTDTNRVTDNKTLSILVHRISKTRCFEPVKRTSEYHKKFVIAYYCYYFHKQPIVQYFFYSCVIFNSIILCFNRIEQSQTEFNIMEVLNILMVSIFSFEVFLIIVGQGLKKYTRDLLNIWDFLVVAISLIEVVILRNYVYTSKTSSNSLASIFRMMRMLRLFKLIRSWENFQVIVASIKETLIRMADYLLLFALFLFIFTLLGCSFFKDTLKFDKITGKYSIYAKSNFYNFDDFLSSLISVFQILIGDEWHKFFFDCFRSEASSTTAAIFFFLFIVLMGQITMMNIFLAYLIDNFERARKHLNKNIKVKTFMENLIYYTSQQHELEKIDYKSKLSQDSVYNYYLQKLQNKKLLSEGRFIISAKSELDFFLYKKKKTEVYDKNLRKSSCDKFERIIFFDNWFMNDKPLGASNIYSAMDSMEFHEIDIYYEKKLEESEKLLKQLFPQETEKYDAEGNLNNYNNIDTTERKKRDAYKELIKKFKKSAMAMREKKKESGKSINSKYTGNFKNAENNKDNTYDSGSHNSQNLSRKKLDTPSIDLNPVTEENERNMTYRSLGISELDAPVLDDHYDDSRSSEERPVRRTRTEVNLKFLPLRLNLDDQDTVEMENSKNTKGSKETCDKIKSSEEEKNEKFSSPKERVNLPPVIKDDDYEDLSKLMSKNINFAINQLTRKIEEEKSEKTSSNNLRLNSSVLTMRKKSNEKSKSSNNKFHIQVNIDPSRSEKEEFFSPMLEDSVLQTDHLPEEAKLRLKRTKTMVHELSKRKILKIQTLNSDEEDFDVENFIESNKNINNVVDYTQEKILKKKLTKMNSSAFSKTKTFESIIPEKRQQKPRVQFRKNSFTKNLEERIKKNPGLYSFLMDLFDFIRKSSLCIFHRDSKFRQFIKKLIEHEFFDYGITVVIIMNCVLLCLDTPWVDPDGDLFSIIQGLNIAFSIIFLIESMLKIIAYGLFFRAKDEFKMNSRNTNSFLVEAEKFLKDRINTNEFSNLNDYDKLELVKKSIRRVQKESAYLRSISNIIDFVVVLIGILDVLGTKNIRFLRTLRAMRSIRPIRIITKNNNLKLIVSCIIKSIPAMGNVLLVCAIFVFIYALLGIDLFKLNLNYYCSNIEYITKETCISNGGHWLYNNENFSNFLLALKTLFELMMAQGWADTMKIAAQNMETKWTYLYFVSYLVIGYLFILNLLVSIVVQKFKILKHKENHISQLTEEEREWIKVQKIMLKFRPVPKFKVDEQSRFKKYLLDFIVTKKFENLLVIIILLSMIPLVMQFNQSGETYNLILDVINYFFIFLFNLEMTVKVYVYGKIFFYNGWNIFDLTVVVFCDVLVIINILTFAHIVDIQNLSSIPIILRTFRFLRIVRLVTVYSKLRALIDTLVYLVPSILNIGIVMFILILIYGCVGMNLFGGVPYRENIHSNNNFRNFLSSALLLFRVTTGENWNYIMNEVAYHNCTDLNSDFAQTDYYCVNYNITCTEDDNFNYTNLINGQFQCGNDLSYIYFISFMILGPIFILNLCIVMVIEGFSESMYENEDLLSQDYMDNFVSVWLNYDPDCRKLVRPHEFVLILKELHPPLGFNYDRHYIFDPMKMYRQRQKFLTIRKAIEWKKNNKQDLILTDQSLVKRNNTNFEIDIDLLKDMGKINDQLQTVYEFKNFYLSRDKKFYTTDLEVLKLTDKFKFSAAEKKIVSKNSYTYTISNKKEGETHSEPQEDKIFIHFVDACLGLSRLLVSKKNYISYDKLREDVVGNFTKKMWTRKFDDVDYFFSGASVKEKLSEKLGIRIMKKVKILFTDKLKQVRERIEKRKNDEAEIIKNKAESEIKVTESKKEMENILDNGDNRDRLETYEKKNSKKSNKSNKSNLMVIQEQQESSKKIVIENIENKSNKKLSNPKLELEENKKLIDDQNEEKELLNNSVHNYDEIKIEIANDSIPHRANTLKDPPSPHHSSSEKISLNLSNDSPSINFKRKSRINIIKPSSDRSFNSALEPQKSLMLSKKSSSRKPNFSIIMQDDKEKIQRIDDSHISKLNEIQTEFFTGEDLNNYQELDIESIIQKKF